VGLSFAVAMILQIIVLSAQTPESTADAMAKIKEMTERLRTERSPMDRMEIGLRLSRLIRLQVQTSTAMLAPSLVDDLANLLRHEDDVVRYWAATALGQIGAPAARAIPALEQALKNAPQYVEPVPGWKIAPALTSETAIRDALQRIQQRGSTGK
jgi:HEAT repeat protein